MSNTKDTWFEDAFGANTSATNTSTAGTTKSADSNWFQENFRDYIKKPDAQTLGEQQAVEFNQQLAKFPKAGAIQKLNTFEQYQGKFKDHLNNKGYSAEEITAALKRFGEKADPSNDSFSSLALDAGKNVMTGFGDIATDLVGAVAQGSDFHKYMSDATNDWRRSLSTAGQIANYKFDRDIENYTTAGDNESVATLKAAKNNPRAIGNMALSTIPQQVAIALATGGVGLGAINAAAGVGSNRNAISETYERTAKENPEQLMRLPQIQERMKKGMTFEEAVDDAKNDVSDNWQSIARAAAIGGLDAISPLGKLGKGLNLGVAGTMAKEIGLEALQEGVEQVNDNYAVGQIDGKTGLFDNVQKNATLGAIMGAGMAIPSGIDAYQNGKQIKADKQAKQDFEQSINSQAQAQTAENQVTENPATQTPQADANIIDEVLNHANLSDEDRKAYHQDLQTDILNGKLQERVSEPSQYGDIVRDYLNRTGQTQQTQAETQAVKNPQKFTNQPTAEEVALQQQANQAPTQARNVVLGAQDTVDIGENDYQPFQYEVMEAADLAPTQDKAGNQLRDRNRTSSTAQVNKIARNLDPRKLTDSPTMDMGAPLLAQDGQTIIAGNGRSMAVRQAYQEGNADNYKQYLQANAGKFGLDANQVARMQNPVLVRRLNTAVDIKQTAINSNEQGGMRMSNLEQAKVDAGRLPNMASFTLGKNGEINTPDNRGFITQFIQNQPETLRNELLDSQGALSQTGVQRLRNAMLYRAYGDTDTLARMVESTEQGSRNIINALTKIAPKVAQVKQDIANGEISDVDISADIVSAVGKYHQLRSQNKDIGEYLQQQDFVSELTPEAKSVLRIFDENARSTKRISDILSSYYHSAETQGNRAQSSMFDEGDFNKAGTLEQAKKADLEARYSLREGDNTPFARAVDEIANGKNVDAKNGKFIQMGTTPDVLKMLGVPNTKIRINETVIEKVMGENLGVPNGKYSHIHNLTTGDLKQLPQQINNPVAILRSSENSSNPDGLVVLTELNEQKTKNGRNEPVIVALHIKARKNGAEIIDVASAYGKGKTWLETELSNNLLYVNKAKGQQFLNTNSLQLGLDFTSDADLSAHNVKTENDLSQYQNQQGSADIAKNTTAQAETAHARQVLEKALGKHAERIELVRTSELDQNDSAYKGKSTSEGWYQDGKLYINLDNILATDILSKDERLAWVGWHELAHNGVDVQFKSVFTNIMNRANEHVVIKEIAKRIKAQRQAEGMAITNEVATEEAMVELFAAQQTGNWAELESRYKANIHQSWKAPQGTLSRLLSQIARVYKRLISHFTGKNVEGISDQELFDLLDKVKQGIEIAKNRENLTALKQDNDPRYSFAGEKAQTADHSMLAQAKADIANGVDPETVRQQTGWFKGVDGKWRFEIDDSQTNFIGKDELERRANSDPYKMFEGKVSDILEHSELFKSYPELADITVMYESSDSADGDFYYGAWFDPNANEIMLGNGLTEEQLKSGLLHELQHIVQQKENFARGASSSDKNYQNVAGEVESRNVQTRMNMSAEERRSRSPESTEDVARADQTVNYGNQRSDFALREGDNTPFARAVDAVANGEELSSSKIQLGTTPDVLKMLGVNDAPVIITAKTLRKDMIKKHRVSPEAMRQLPAQMNNPVAVMQSREDSTNPEAYLMLTELTEQEKGKNKPIIAALSFEKNADGEFELIEVSSAYGRRPSQINRDLENVLYWNKTKGEKLLNNFSLLEADDSASLRTSLFNADRLSESNIKTESDLSQYQSENSNSEPRFSRPQSALDQMKNGERKRNEESSIAGDLAKGNFKQAMSKARQVMAENWRDETRPLRDWIDGLPIERYMQKDLVGAADRADLIRAAKNSEVIDKFFRPLMRNLGKLQKNHSKKTGKDRPSLEMTKFVAEYWYSARWSIIKSEQILESERQAMLEAEKALNEAKANPDTDKDVLAKAYRTFARAEAQYLGRKADVESTVFGRDENDELKYKPRVGQIGGWSIPHAKAIMAEAEKYFDPKYIEIAMKPLREAIKWNLMENRLSHRITEEMYQDFLKHPEYVPLTGDPRKQADDMDDFIAGASSKGVNTKTDKAMKGRTNSEAEGAIDAVNAMLDKTNANTAWNEFKMKLDEVYETLLKNKKQSGLTEIEAKHALSEEFGLTKSALKGTTRTSDKVIIRKFKGVSYEYGLPDKVIQAVLGAQQGDPDLWIYRAFSTLTGWFARGVTQYRPTFAPKNMIADIWERATVLPTREILDANGKDFDQKIKDKMATKMWSRLINPLKPLETTKDLAGMFSATAKLAAKGKTQLDTQNKYQAALKRLIDLGGVSTFRESLYKTEKNLLAQLKAENAKLDVTTRSITRMVAIWNGMFDYISSLTAFMTMEEFGVPSHRAAEITLNLTNFNKVGKLTKKIRGVYAFLNPTLQGSGNLADVLSTKRGAFALLKAVAFFTSIYSLFMYFEDDDEMGNKYLRKDLSKNILIPNVEDEYFKIPIGYGLPQLGAAIASNGLKAMHGQISATDAAAEILAHSAKSFTPVAPSEISAAKYPLAKFLDTITPTMAKPLTQASTNRNAFGAQITYSNERAKTLKADQGKSSTADVWKTLAVEMNESIGIDMEPEMYQHLFNSYRGFIGIAGEVWSDHLENPNRALQGKDTTTWQRAIGAFYGKVGQNETVSFFYQAKSEADLLAKARASYADRETKDKHPLSSEDKAILLWKNRVENALKPKEKRKRELNKLREKKQISETQFTKSITQLNLEIEQIQKSAIGKFRQIKGLRTTTK